MRLVTLSQGQTSALNPLDNRIDQQSRLFFEDVLYRLFRADLDKLEADIPRPVSAPLGLPKRLRLAGPLGTSAHELQAKASDSELLLLERLIDFVKHFSLLEQYV